MIVPAPRETREETGVIWYEAQVSEDGSLWIGAYASREEEVARAELHLGDGGAFTYVLHDVIEVRLDVQVTQGGNEITGEIDGQYFTLTDDGPDGLDLDDDQEAVLRRWGLLADAWEALAQANRQSWGLVSCALLAMSTGASAGFCAAGALLACPAALGTGGVFWHNCVET
jgi:hypothetical protein